MSEYPKQWDERIVDFFEWSDKASVAGFEAIYAKHEKLSAEKLSQITSFPLIL